MHDTPVIGLTGMPGAGKSIVVRVARKRGYDVFVMGDVVREEVRRRGLVPNPENIGEVMLELRKNEGPTVIAKRCISDLTQNVKGKLIIDGIRSLEEVEEFNRCFPKFTLLAIHSSPETRFRRIYHRQRCDDPKNWNSFLERDMRELCVGLGNAIAMSEQMIVNEGNLKTFKAKIGHFLQRIEKQWTK